MAENTGKVGKAVVERVVAKLEETVEAVTTLAGAGRDFEAAGERLVGYGANEQLVELAVELAQTRA